MICLRPESIEPRWSKNSSILHDVLSEIDKVGIPELVVIEGYSFNSGYQAHQLGEVGGLLRHGIWLRGIRILEVPPTKLKRFVCGKGIAQKDELRLYAYKNWGLEEKSQHALEAYCLSVLGASCFGPDVAVGLVRNNVQREVVEECLMTLR